MLRQANKNADIYRMNITFAIIKARKDQKVSIQDAAKLINVSRQLYSKYENEGNIPLNKLELLCSRLKLKLIILPEDLLK
jgi:transcriptional regulator with XRE-family HTH domain